MKTPEGYEKADIDKYLKWIGVYVVKPTTGGFGASGHSDRIFCMNGVFWIVEVKREGSEPTALQWRRIQECQAAGGEAVWGTAPQVIMALHGWRLRHGLVRDEDEVGVIHRILRTNAARK